jgi:hypothetical protein
VQEIILSKEIIKALAHDLYDIIVQDIRAAREEEQAKSMEKENQEKTDEQDLKSA